MVTSLKRRIALALLLGVLVIPILTTNTGGLNLVLFCTAEVAQPFALSAPTVDGEQPDITSSVTLERDEIDVPVFAGDQAVTPICEGVRAEISAQPLSAERVLLTITLVNDSELPWRGSIGLAASGGASNADLTAAIGEVRPGEVGSAELELRVTPGQTQIDGTLLLGP